ncbi:hypothetical protein ONA91_31900 [Micromonospora sp. DR5-3]|uniref:hypothetical protein n=1 Tax=unclassified Micromonospora TaxID=2617518 RepID=UPI00165200F0|nr:MULTISPECIES: hypothetical protein [unclassified Micromonospora]MCW3819052.1 hypothetical protein [Micromonospora sp. DR5-3]
MPGLPTGNRIGVGPQQLTVPVESAALSVRTPVSGSSSWTPRTTDLHVCAVEWDSRGMRFLVDSTEVFYAGKDTVEATRGSWVF